MPIVVFANPKGGAGKSTSALVIASALAAQGATLSILDCDPNRPIRTWAATGKTKAGLHVFGDVSENTIVRIIESEAATKQFVFVDLEGTASRLVSRAISRASLVVVPMQPSPLDSEQAGRALALVQEEEEVLRRKIPTAVLFTRTSPAIPTKHEKQISGGLREAGIAVFKNHLHQRQAYQAIYAEGLTLDELDANSVNGLVAARENATALAAELLTMIEAMQ